jgi:hypothetical protein
MNLLGVRLQLLIGENVPVIAPAKVVEALQSVEATHSDQGRSGFQLTFQVGRSSLDLDDYSLLKNPLLQPFNRVVLVVFFAITRYVLMDGIITNHSLSPGNDPGASTFTVTGEDISVMMDLKEKIASHVEEKDEQIVEKLLNDYSGLYRLKLEVQAAPAVEQPNRNDITRNQHGTDLNYIQSLAGLHGYVFYITPGPNPLQNTAYWGPPKREGERQPALSVNLGPNTNVDSISFRYNGLAPNKVTYRVNGTERTIDQSTRTPPLAATPAPLRRVIILSDMGRVSTGRAEDQAQGQVNQSLDQVVTADGELDGLRYGGLLQPRGLVGLRGVGRSYDGTYYVKSVTHRINVRNGEYKQSFSLARDGLGTLSPLV